MIEEFFSLFLGVILVTLIFSTKNEKHSNELNEVIINIKKQAEEMESHIKDEYNLPIENAIKELEKVKTSLVKSIYWFSKYIE
jgi:hypothetical protein